MDYVKMEEAAAELKNRVASMVTQTFAAAPAAASAAAGSNMNYAFSPALIAAFAQIATAIKKLTDHATEHANLIENSAKAIREQDEQRALREFNAATTFPPQRSTGSTNA
jgi:hypothetical protein